MEVLADRNGRRQPVQALCAGAVGGQAGLLLAGDIVARAAAHMTQHLRGRQAHEAAAQLTLRSVQEDVGQCMEPSEMHHCATTSANLLCGAALRAGALSQHSGHQQGASEHEGCGRNRADHLPQRRRPLSL